MKDLRCVYMTAILSMFFYRATERCTKYLRYVYTTTKLSTFLITTTILFTFLLKCKRATELCKKNNDTYIQLRYFLHSL